MVMVSLDEYLMLQLWEVCAWFFPEAASKGAAREHWRRRRRWMRRRRMRGRRGSRRRGRRRRRRIGRLEAAAPPPQSSPSLPVERRISRSCTNPQKSSEPKKSRLHSFSSIPSPLWCWKPTTIASSTTGQYHHIKPWRISRTKVIHETCLPEVETSDKYTNWQKYPMQKVPPLHFNIAPPDPVFKWLFGSEWGGKGSSKDSSGRAISVFSLLLSREWVAVEPAGIRGSSGLEDTLHWDKLWNLAGCRPMGEKWKETWGSWLAQFLWCLPQLARVRREGSPSLQVSKTYKSFA